MPITRFFAEKIADYSKEKSVGSKMRKKRVLPLLSMIEDTYQKHGHVNIVDIGGTSKYWNLVSNEVLSQKNIHITIVNIPGGQAPKDTEFFTFVEADGCDLTMFEAKLFHIAHSNSVIEHVGDWVRMVQFSKEVTRVAEKYFVQTPNYWFPLEPHCMTPFFHWLPKPLRVSLILRFNLGHWSRKNTIDLAVRTVESARLLDKKMFCALFKEADIKVERFFLLPKSFIAIKK